MKERFPEQNNNRSPYIVLVYIIMLLFSLVICYKVVFTEVQFNFKFNDLLTMLISLFAIGMSIIFYFKTTETSNRFYDNANRFTTDVRSTLSSIESGFREMLQNIQAGNTLIQNKIDNISLMKEKIKQETSMIDKIEFEKGELIKEYITKNDENSEEIKMLINQLEEKNAKIFQQQENIAKLMIKIDEASEISSLFTVQLEKISNLKDNHPIEIGYIKRGKFINSPKVGESFWIGSSFRTSVVQEIIDENTFKTANSIYRWSLI